MSRQSENLKYIVIKLCKFISAISIFLIFTDHSSDCSNINDIKVNLVADSNFEMACSMALCKNPLSQVFAQDRTLQLEIALLFIWDKSRQVLRQALGRLNTIRVLQLI